MAILTLIKAGNRFIKIKTKLKDIQILSLLIKKQ